MSAGVVAWFGAFGQASAHTVPPLIASWAAGTGTGSRAHVLPAFDVLSTTPSPASA
jgi:hypothetical protein